jgi:hypothetical protein
MLGSLFLLFYDKEYKTIALALFIFALARIFYK